MASRTNVPNQPFSGKLRPESSADDPSSNHLESIDKLLNAAFELMKRDPAIDSTTFEQLRQLRVRIRFALSAHEPNNDSAAPKIAPVLFKNRDNDEDAISFTKRVYAKWLGTAICRADIQKLDPQLYNALYNLANSGDRMSEIGLLTKKQLNDLRLKNIGQIRQPSTTLRLGELPPSQREHARLFNLARRRKQALRY
jgi:hypothetical protein